MLFTIFLKAFYLFRDHVGQPSLIPQVCPIRILSKYDINSRRTRHLKTPFVIYSSALGHTPRSSPLDSGGELECDQARFVFLLKIHTRAASKHNQIIVLLRGKTGSRGACTPGARPRQGRHHASGGCVVWLTTWSVTNRVL